MPYLVRFRSKAEKELTKIPKKDKQRILVAILSLAKNPFCGKKLAGKYQDCYSARVWPYRIIYSIRKTELSAVIIRIGQRGNVYK